MTSNPYRNAYEAAMAELAQISAKFEQLRTRKNHIENLISALQSVFAPDQGPGAEVSSVNETPVSTQDTESTGENPVEAEPPAGYSYLDVPNPLPESEGDPFQRRVKSSFRFKGLAAQRSF